MYKIKYFSVFRAAAAMTFIYDQKCFADIVDMDRLGAQVYTPEVLVEMAEGFRKALAASGCGMSVLSREKAEAILEQARMGGVGVPRMVLESILETGGESDG